MSEVWATLTEAAARLQMTEEAVHRWIRKKSILAHRVGHNWRVEHSVVDQWARAGCAAPEMRKQKRHPRAHAVTRTRNHET